MLDRFIAYVLLASGGLSLASGETIHLRDKVSVTGPILSEKPDHVVVDLGFMLLSIPKSQIAKISKESAGKEQAAVKSSSKGSAPATPAAPVEAKAGLFSAANSPPPERSVRELVSRLGEGVV